MDEKRFDDLIRRYMSGDATAHEKDLVEKWLDRRSQKDPYSTLSREEKLAIRQNMAEELSARMSENTGRQRRPAVFYRAAAAVAVLAVLSYLLLDFSLPSVTREIAMVRESSSEQATRKVILRDSTIVWLKGSSSITYPETFGKRERHVVLSGEALFEVYKDPEHPFVIQCGGLVARVLGTSFNIRTRESGVEVHVLTGKVSLTSRGSREELVVLPNEKAIYNEERDRVEKLDVVVAERTARIAGTEYPMDFHATAMEEIIRRIEGKFDVRVSVSDERLKNCTITADFTDQSLDRTLSLIAQTLKLEYEIRNGEVMLKGKGCDR